MLALHTYFFIDFEFPLFDVGVVFAWHRMNWKHWSIFFHFTLLRPKRWIVLLHVNDSNGKHKWKKCTHTHLLIFQNDISTTESAYTVCVCVWKWIRWSNWNMYFLLLKQYKADAAMSMNARQNQIYRFLCLILQTSNIKLISRINNKICQLHFAVRIAQFVLIEHCSYLAALFTSNLNSIEKKAHVKPRD